MSIQLRSRVRRSISARIRFRAAPSSSRRRRSARDIALELVLGPRISPRTLVLLDGLSVPPRRPLPAASGAAATSGSSRTAEPWKNSRRARFSVRVDWLRSVWETVPARPSSLAVPMIGSSRKSRKSSLRWKRFRISVVAPDFLHVERHHEVDRRREIDPQGPLDMRLPIALPLEQLKLHAGVAGVELAERCDLMPAFRDGRSSSGPIGRLSIPTSGVRMKWKNRRSSSSPSRSGGAVRHIRRPDAAGGRRTDPRVLADRRPSFRPRRCPPWNRTAP